MNEQENLETPGPRQVPSPAGDPHRGEERTDLSGTWDSYSVEVLHALDD